MQTEAAEDEAAAEDELAGEGAEYAVAAVAQGDHDSYDGVFGLPVPPSIFPFHISPSPLDISPHFYYSLSHTCYSIVRRFSFAVRGQ